MATTVDGVDLDRYGSGPTPAWLGVDWSEHLRWITLGGRPVNVLDVGSGDPILFVHGHSGCWQHWLDQIAPFSQTNRVIALDLPGFGRSPMPAGGISMTGYAALLDELCAALEVDAACVVGSSMGGFISAELAIRHPQRVERLVLVGAAGLSDRYIGLPTAFITHPTGATAGRVLLGMGGVPKPLARSIAARPRARRAVLLPVVTRPEDLHPSLVFELVRGAGKPGGAPAALALAGYDFRDRLDDIACPTLVVWGDRDWFVGNEAAHHYERMIPNARKVVYEGTGHIPMVERPARFNADLSAFLSE